MPGNFHKNNLPVISKTLTICSKIEIFDQNENFLIRNHSESKNCNFSQIPKKIAYNFCQNNADP